MEKEKIYIFDLDHTLINAEKLKEDIGALLKNDKNIISEKIWEAFENKNLKLINFLKNKMERYIFENVVENLREIKDKKILLSFGNIEFQRAKIDALGFEKYFNEVVLTDKNKIEFLEKFYLENKGREIIFVNDTYNKRFYENDELNNKIPEIKIFEVDNYILKKNIDIDKIFKKLKK